MEYQLTYKSFRLIRVYKHYGLYENQFRIRECFDLFDLGKIKNRKKELDITNSVMAKYLK